MIKVRDLNILEQTYRMYNLNIRFIDNVQYFGNGHIAINLASRSVQVFDTQGAETAINLFLVGALCLDKN